MTISVLKEKIKNSHVDWEISVSEDGQSFEALPPVKTYSGNKPYKEPLWGDLSDIGGFSGF